jgi:hypothetical protein
VTKTIEGYLWADADKVSFYRDNSTDDDEADATVYIGENAKASETERWAALNVDAPESWAASLDPGRGAVISKHSTREAAEAAAVAYLNSLAELSRSSPIRGRADDFRGRLIGQRIDIACARGE